MYVDNDPLVLGKMALRWCSAGMLEADHQFTRPTRVDDRDLLCPFPQRQDSAPRSTPVQHCQCRQPNEDQKMA
jgi:hypothetical protein